MKIFTKFIKVLATLGLFSSCAFALTDGIEYKVLERPLSVGDNTLTKVFSYACSHCYKFDKGVTQKVMSKLDGVKFIPYHLKSKGEFGETVSGILASMISLDEEKNIGYFDDKSLFKRAKFAIYRSYHDKNEQFSDKNEYINKILKDTKVNRSDYEKALSTTRAQEILSSWDDSYSVAVLSGVPAFVVNGKYLINLDAAYSIDKLIEIIKELLGK
ncbi:MULTISPECIES: DsbA family protein [unclassified Campylobacter]|uniref:DsbA family protein n=1 Tax=unclassified Campylobacter TaxID=2593542 RepID=UPI001451C959|nr:MULTISPECIES: DsbA family protein [unclassified Campylobacter]QCD53341.1 protein disulfide oxidoreductase [Campylobacter sp. RM16192]QKG28503.1 protein disulfide oxidoreductase [Campylobacter sp. RM16187]